MKVHNTMIEDVLVSRHAKDEFLDDVERLNGQTLKPEKVKSALSGLWKLFRRSEQVERKNRLTALLKHKEHAEYFTADGWIFVVVSDFEGNKTMKTCYHKGSSNVKENYRRK